MSNYKFLTLLLFFCFTFNVSNAQHRKHPSKTKQESKRYDANSLEKVKPIRENVPYANQPFHQLAKPYKTLPALQAPTPVNNFTVVRDTETNLPISIKGSLKIDNSAKSIDVQCHEYLEAISKEMQLEKAANQFEVQRVQNDELGHTHIRMQQTNQGIPVYGSEIILHANNGKIRSMTGRYFPEADLKNITPSLSISKAFDLTKAHLSTLTNINEPSPQMKKYVSEDKSELVIYHTDVKDMEGSLCWHITTFPNVTERWECFVNATTGLIENAYKNSCSLVGCTHGSHAHHSKNHVAASSKITTSKSSEIVGGPTTANAVDLQGITRTINVYEDGGTYFMIDASRPMYNSNASNLPNSPVGCIWTIDGDNKHPNSFSFETFHVASNNNTWNDPIAVSAHYNGGLAYEYFRNTHNRNSINGNGGNIVSLINIAEEDGSSMENAFWNGQAMFYGNGGQAFQPLARAVDVAGHEMSHGVIQSTANLEYISQSGALNESFADIFGAMIDRNDWKIGEDVVNTNVFPSGALRDLSNPNNGGNSLNDPGWQPKTMSEYQNLPNTPQGDNGGVHINSGIPNYAFFLLASDIGKSNAEDIYYKALTDYLTKSSQFTDLRIAVTRAASDLFGGSSNQVSAVNSAFDAVGIAGGQGGNYEEDLDVNPGEDYILLTDGSLSQLYLTSADGSGTSILSTTSPLSKPSVTDDGSLIIFIGSDKRMYAIEIDWATGNNEEYLLQDESIWRNVAISKDGNRLAALTDENDNTLYIYDFVQEDWNTYELYNPTFTQGVSTGDVQYADALEWDITGESVMYDAFNVISSDFGGDIEYWDVGFIRVWNNGTNNWGQGTVEKLFSGLPENTSIGNPTFAKNSPYIVAFDFIDADNNVQLLATNIETGETSDPPIFSNSILNYPNYSRLDDKMLFDANDNGGNQVLAIVDLQDNKLQAVSNTAAVLVDQGKWGVWFAEGERDLTVSLEEIEEKFVVKVSPNPFIETIQLEGNTITSGEMMIRLTDLSGKVILQESRTIAQGNYNETIHLNNLAAGTYVIYTTMANQLSAHKIVKIK